MASANTGRKQIRSLIRSQLAIYCEIRCKLYINILGKSVAFENTYLSVNISISKVLIRWADEILLLKLQCIEQ